MYGIINQSIQELVLRNFGEETWLMILAKSKVDVVEFANHTVYDDAYTYRLASAAAEVLDTSLENVLKLFGEFWILEISLKKYPSMTASGGQNIDEFMANLPKFHNRVYLTYPHLIAPEFNVRIDDEGIWVEYHSKRSGLASLMEGMLYGIIKMFREKMEVSHVKSKAKREAEYDLFLMTRPRT